MRNYYHHSSVVSILRDIELNIIWPNLKTTSWSRSLKLNSLFLQTIILCKLVNNNLNKEYYLLNNFEAQETTFNKLKFFGTTTSDTGRPEHMFMFGEKTTT